MNCGQWLQLDAIPRDINTDLVLKLNEQQIIFPAKCAHKSKWNGLYVYNLHSRKFQKFFTFPETLGQFIYSLQFDSAKNKIYGISNKCPLFIIDLHEGIVGCDAIKSQQHRLQIKSMSANLLEVNGDIHWIGGYDNETHLVWREESRNLYPLEPPPSRHRPDLLVYVSKKRMIIMIAGNIIYKYCLKINRWQKLRLIPFAHVYGSIVLTSDEKYILMSHTDSRYVHAFNIDNNRVYKSSVQRPVEPHFLIKTGGIKDELLVVGWIRFVFKLPETQYMQEPPMYLMTLIARWYSQEELHWISKCYNQNFTINIQDVLCSLKNIA